MSNNDLQFLDKRHITQEPDYGIYLYVTGVKCFEDKIHWHVEVEGEDDPEEVIQILERAIEVMQQKINI